jgi:hypothetical protein
MLSDRAANDADYPAADRERFRHTPSRIEWNNAIMDINLYEEK